MIIMYKRLYRGMLNLGTAVYARESNQKGKVQRSASDPEGNVKNPCNYLG